MLGKTAAIVVVVVVVVNDVFVVRTFVYLIGGYYSNVVPSDGKR